MKKLLSLLLSLLLLLGTPAVCASGYEQVMAPCHGTTAIRNANGRYLASSGISIFTDPAAQQWRLEAITQDRFYLKDSTGFYVLEYYGGKLAMCEDTGYTEQQWTLRLRDDGSYRIVHADSGNYYLASDALGNLSVVHKSQDSGNCAWFLENPRLTSGYPYIEFVSRNKVIVLRLAPEVLNVISSERLQRWANELEFAHDSFCDLTGWNPFPQMEVRGYTDCASWGYVFSGKPVIHINRQCLYDDLKKMAAREDDWNFGALHEMSHLFDHPRWDFHGEILANFKLAYVLMMHNGHAAPAEFPADEVFSYATLRDGIYQLDGTLLNPRSTPINGLIRKLWEVVDEIGWYPAKQAFHHCPDIPGATAYEKFNAYIDLLSYYSGKNVRDYFTAAEWDVIRSGLAGR